MNYIITLIIIIITLYIFNNKFNNKNNIKYKPIPSPFRLPIIGNLNQMGGELHLQFDKWYKQYGCIFKIKAGSIDVVVLTGYSMVKKAFIDNGDSFSNRYQFKSKVQLNDCDDIVFQNGDKHVLLKKILLGEMTTIKIKKMEDHIIKETEKLIKLLDKHADQGTPFEINEYISMYSLNVILRFLFGVDYPYVNVKETEGIIKSIKDMFHAAGKPIPSDFLSFIAKPNSNTHPFFVNYNNLAKDVEQLINKHLIHNSNNEEHTILSKLIKEYNDNKSISWNTIINTAIDFVAAGSDTSSNTMIFFLIAISNLQHIQDKLANEINSNIKHDDNNTIQVITHSKYQSLLPYLTMSIKETYRMYPVPTIGIPHVVSEDVVIDNHYISKGTLVFQNVYSSHRSNEFFTSPDQFIPERFIESTNLTFGNETKLLHFGIGSRSCIGKSIASTEIFTLLATLINRYQFINPNDKPLNDIGTFGIAYEPPLTYLIIKKRK